MSNSLYETKRFYIYNELVNGVTWYFVGVKGIKGYMFCSQSKEACIREANYYERFKNINFEEAV